FNGDLAQLLSTRQEGFGGIAWVRTLCQPYSIPDSSGRYSFCGIDTTYFNFPTFSWTVTVMTHEMGHNFGSMHTQACWWPVEVNKIGAIDSCYTAEGGCFSSTRASYNGTIMSYCHLNGAIVLRNGFGSMPGDTIRLRYNQGACFGTVINSSEHPAKFSLMQNYPNPFNPGTNLQFDVPLDARVTLKVYDINGREIAQLKNSAYYSPGTYSIYFNTVNYALSSGVYFYKIFAVDASSPSKVLFTEVKKMLYIK
ncbi:T9SS C-terminal target domain-containing protein, partial [bacterium]